MARRGQKLSSKRTKGTTIYADGHPMEIEYDETKRQANIKKHGVDLLFGALIFEGPTFEVPSPRNGEDRILAVGLVDGEVFVTVYVKRGDAIRLISTRKGGRRDRQRYEEALSG